MKFVLLLPFLGVKKTYLNRWQQTWEMKKPKINAFFSIVAMSLRNHSLTLCLARTTSRNLLNTGVSSPWSLYINVVVGAGGDWCSSSGPVITTVRSTLFYFIYLHLYQLKPSLGGWRDGTADCGTMRDESRPSSYSYYVFQERRKVYHSVDVFLRADNTFNTRPDEFIFWNFPGQ